MLPCIPPFVSRLVMNASTKGKGEWLNPVADSASVATAIELEGAMDTPAGAGDCMEPSEAFESFALLVCHTAELLGRILMCSGVMKLNDET